MRKKILITGSAGFIGSNFIRKIIFDKYPCELFSVDKLTNSTMINNMYQHKLHEFFIGDICDYHLMNKIFEYVKPNIVIHMAAEASVDKSIKEPGIFAKTNVVGTQVLVDLAVKYKVDNFVMISTDEVYPELNEKDPSWTETASLNPRNPYSATKAASELVVRAAGNTHKLPFIITRSANNHGPRQTKDKLIPRVIDCVLNKKPIPVYGEGLNRREWIHTWDNCSAITTIIDKGKLGETYNISTGDEKTNLELIKTICDIMESGHDLITFVPDRAGHDFRYSINSDKLTKLGWKPIFKFEDGISNTVKWYLDNKFFLENNNVS